MPCAPDNVNLAAHAHPAKAWEESILRDMYRFVPNSVHGRVYFFFRHQAQHVESNTESLMQQGILP
jgi:hypothetical protein